MSLFLEIYESAAEAELLTETIVEQLPTVFSGFSDQSIAVICESAATVLGELSAQIKFKGQVKDLEYATDMITALKMIGMRDNREALNVNTKTFAALIRRAGETPNADAALKKLANHPSVRTVRQNTSNMLSALSPEEDNKNRDTLNSINKLRLGYERALNSINHRQNNEQPA